MDVLSSPSTLPSAGFPPKALPSMKWDLQRPLLGFFGCRINQSTSACEEFANLAICQHHADPLLCNDPLKGTYLRKAFESGLTEARPGRLLRLQSQTWCVHIRPATWGKAWGLMNQKTSWDGALWLSMTVLSSSVASYSWLKRRVGTMRKNTSTSWFQWLYHFIPYFWGDQQPLKLSRHSTIPKKNHRTSQNFPPISPRSLWGNRYTTAFSEGRLPTLKSPSNRLRLARPGFC